jgi:hypothetical protein
MTCTFSPSGEAALTARRKMAPTVMRNGDVPCAFRVLRLPAAYRTGQAG